MDDAYDVVVVGGGFFGAVLALEARRHRRRVLLIEAEAELMTRASYANQARIHGGYHYPRSLLTAERSRVNLPLFAAAYDACVVDDFHKLYAIARQHSKVSAAQFRRFCERIGAPIARAPKPLLGLFDPSTVEDVFTVQEYAFDASKLRGIVRRHLEEAGVELLLRSRVARVDAGADLRVHVGRGGEAEAHTIAASWLFNCTYAQLNGLLRSAQLEPIPLKQELVEIALVAPSAPFDRLGITVMDGPFFSCMPFPPAGAHSLTHVRYTPHRTWVEPHEQALPLPEAADRAQLGGGSLFQHMVRDVRRFVPDLGGVRYLRSLWEVKTLLPQSERDDSRPILFRRSAAAPRFISVLGAKIDNVIDMRERMSQLLG